jgi:PAS domain S-box-containing protein
MTKLEKIAELRTRAEEALKRSFAEIYSGNSTKPVDQLTAGQIETLLENEELRLSKEQLQRELKTYKDLFNYAPVAYITLDAEGVIHHFNKAAYGYIPNEGLKTGKLSVFQITSAESHFVLSEMIEQAFTTGLEQSGHLPLRMGHNDYTDHRILVSRYKDRASQTYFCKMIILSMTDDANDYKEELRDEKEAYLDLMNNIDDGIFYAKQGILYSVNNSMAGMLGYNESELLGKPIWSLTTKYYKNLVRALFLKRENFDLKPAYDIKCVRKDGSIQWMEFKIKHLENQDKSFCMVSDITRRKETEHKLKRSERDLKRSNAAKDKFFSIVSHDLKTPFNTLMGYNYLLMKEYKQYDDEKRESMIRTLYDITKQTFNLLENILVWSRSHTGSIPYAPRRFNITKMLLENIRLYTPTARSKNISLILEPDIQNIEVFADPEMIHTVIRNLVNNALKFTNEQGEVRIGVFDYDPEKVSVTVTDTGIGIDPKKSKDIFRIDSSSSTRGTHYEKGTGLGLGICKEFVVKNKGTIWVDSVPGQGSRFSFTLYKENPEE